MLAPVRLVPTVVFALTMGLAVGETVTLLTSPPSILVEKLRLVPKGEGGCNRMTALDAAGCMGRVAIIGRVVGPGLEPNVRAQPERRTGVVPAWFETQP